MVGANPVATKDLFQGIERVQTMIEVQRLLPYLAHDAWVSSYLATMWKDPNTLVIYKDQSVLIASIINHPFTSNSCIIVWAQNPSGVNVWTALRYVNEWAKRKNATHIMAFVGDDGPWKKAKALVRLTGMQPQRMLLMKEIG